MKDIQGAQILLVEDNEINQQVAKEILAGGGLKVTVANDGQEGLEAAMQNQYDAILMDIQMPVMDGYTATRKIREWEAGKEKSAFDKLRRAKVGMRNAEKELKAKGSKLNEEDSDDLSAFSFEPSARAKRVPIIAMTAHAMAGDEKKSIEAGMNDHVTKPIDPDQLFATLQKWVKPAAERVAAPNSLPAPGGPQVLDTPAEPDPAVPDEDELPESLPGFDLVAGLSRLMGNKRLYRKLLIDFGASYGGVANEIREALAAGDLDQVHSLVHNLKGLAGNLEATDLQAAAVEMEKLARGNQKETPSNNQLDQKLMELEKAIDQALEAVQILGRPAEEKMLEPSAEWLAAVPLERLKEVADHIKTAAEMGDVIQLKSTAEELRTKSDSMAPFCDELIRLAEDFDFDGIQKIVIELDN